MNYHNILHDDMRNGSGLRVVLFVSGCSNKCNGCQNPQTWDEKSGIEFDDDAKEEIMNELKHDYIDGITFSGGDPLYDNNVESVLSLCKKIKSDFPNKTIWLYTGYKFESILFPLVTDDLNMDRANLINNRRNIMNYVDILVDGKYDDELADVNYHWAGSTNQRVIDVQKSLKNKTVILFDKESAIYACYGYIKRLIASKLKGTMR